MTGAREWLCLHHWGGGSAFQPLFWLNTRVSMFSLIRVARARSRGPRASKGPTMTRCQRPPLDRRSEEHTSELQSRGHLVCRLLLEKKKKTENHSTRTQQ